jgi:uncharacterized membrane protein YgcG
VSRSSVYTQVKPESDTPELVNADAHALGNQWGVGRKGFDDGLVILFDMQPNLCHGQVQLDAGAGFKAAFLSDSERQAIYENDMDGALAIALSDVDAAATPAHAQQLDQDRIINAAVGIGFLALSIWLAFFILVRWYTHGRDPIYIDDNSVPHAGPSGRSDSGDGHSGHERPDFEPDAVGGHGRSGGARPGPLPPGAGVPGLEDGAGRDRQARGRSPRRRAASSPR